MFFLIISGTFSFDDALSIGGKEERQKLEQVQKHIKFDDAVNIQFTSVSIHLHIF